MLCPLTAATSHLSPGWSSPPLLDNTSYPQLLPANILLFSIARIFGTNKQMWSSAQVATAEFYDFMEFSGQGGHGQSSECRGGSTYHGRQCNLFQNMTKRDKKTMAGNWLQKIVEFWAPPPVAQRERPVLVMMSAAGSSVGMGCCHYVCSRHHFSSLSPARLYLSPAWLYSGSNCLVSSGS